MLLELTCPWDTNISRSHDFKEEKYAPLVADLSRDYKVFHFSIEVSVRGQVSKGNRARLKAFVYRCCRDPKTTTGRLVTHCRVVWSNHIFCKNVYIHENLYSEFHTISSDTTHGISQTSL